MEKIPPLEIKVTAQATEGNPNAKSDVYLQVKIGDFHYFEMFKGGDKPTNKLFMEALERGVGQAIPKIDPLYPIHTHIP